MSTPTPRPSFRERVKADEVQGEHRDGDIRYLIMRPDVLMGLFAALPPTERGNALEALARSAQTYGGRSVQAYRDAGADDASELLRVMVETSAQLGWGRWSFAYEDEGKSLQLTIRNSPFAKGYGKSDTPVCHAARGIFTALAPVVMGGDVSVIESRCAAQDGGDTCHLQMRSL